MEMNDIKCASFIQARDPSILAWNRPAVNPSVKMDLCPAFAEESTTVEKDTETGHLQVYLRLKPCDNLNDLYEIKDNTLTCRVPPGSQFLRNIQDGRKVNRQFSFTKIYRPDINQSEIFNDCVKKQVLGFINGKNCNIFAYGISGSGKTYTILGTESEPGIIPRALEYMFRTLPVIDELPIFKPTDIGDIKLLDTSAQKAAYNLRKNFLNLSTSKDKSLNIRTYKAMQERLSIEPSATIDDVENLSIGIWVSFAEVYNEYIYDLLQPKPALGKQRPKLRLGQNENGNTYIKHLTSISVSSGLEAYSILQYGMHNLNYASTSVNSHSSRSHCVFTIKLVQVASSLEESEVQISHFNFCDLAGSERVKNTNNVGIHLKESNNINTSLHVLGRCFRSMRDSQKKSTNSTRPPFRESKLTSLFQKSLMGGEAITMIVNMNPHRDTFDEGQHVLNFSAIAQEVIVEAEVEPTTKLRRFSQYMQNRITALPSIAESSLSENEILHNQLQNLSLELGSLKMAWAEKELEVRRELQSAFTARTDVINERWQQRLDERIHSITDLFEFKLKSLEEYYRGQVNDSTNTKRARVSIINLDDSEIEDLNNVQANLKNALDQISSLQANATKLSFDLEFKNHEWNKEKNRADELQKQVNAIQQELYAAQKKNREIESVLKDAEIEIQYLEKETLNLQGKDHEIFILQEQLANLQSQLAAQTEKDVNQTEYVEILEDQLDKFKVEI